MRTFEVLIITKVICRLSALETAGCTFILAPMCEKHVICRTASHHPAPNKYISLYTADVLIEMAVKYETV